MKENMLGPSFRNPTGKKGNQDFSEAQIEFLNVISPLRDDEQLQKFLLGYFGKEGEDVYKNTQSLTMFLYLDILLNLEIVAFDVPKEIKIWKARYHMLHNMLLTSNVCYLQDKSLEYYNDYLENMSIEDKNIQAYLWIEYSNCALTFYKYSKADIALENAR
jgi:hypothetical protein